MADRLSGWLLEPPEDQADRAAEIAGKLDAWFAGDVGSNWRGDSDSGLSGTLEVTPGWDWSTTDKLENLKSLVDNVRNRVRLIPPGYPLAAALDGVWGGGSWRQDGPAGLARALDQLPGWQEDSWAKPDLTLDTLRDWLTPLPAAWAAAGVLSDDPETGLKYDDANWYLSDGKTLVFADPVNPGYFYDEAGNWYLKGKLSAAPSGVTAVSLGPDSDLSVQHFDQESQRWRRLAEDDQFEFYHEADGEWERELDTVYGSKMWHRFHSDQAGWLPYDESSRTWLDGDTWRPWEDVGNSPTAEHAEPEQQTALIGDGDEDEDEDSAEGDLAIRVLEMFERLGEEPEELSAADIELLELAHASGLVTASVEDGSGVTCDTVEGSAEFTYE